MEGSKRCVFIQVKKLGIRPAHVRPEAMHAAALHKHSFHLRAPVGWNNEPNGITRSFFWLMLYVL